MAHVLETIVESFQPFSYPSSHRFDGGHPELGKAFQHSVIIISAPFSAIRAADSLGASSEDRDLFQEQEINLHPIELPGKPVVVRNPVRRKNAG